MAQEIELPSGVILYDVPDGLTDEQIKAGAIAQGIATEADFATNQGMFFDMEGDVPVLRETPPRQQPPRPDRSFMDKAIGLGEAALTLGSGATSGAIGFADSALSQAGKEIFAGRFGSNAAADAVQRRAMRGGTAQTYQPRTEAGQEYLRNLEPILGWMPPILGITNPGMVHNQAIRRSGLLADDARVGREVRSLPPVTQQPQPSLSIGAAQVPDATVRRVMGETMPVPFKGSSGLTSGQQSRDFAQLQFERETAKIGTQGAPLRDRYANQNDTMLGNFDTLIERTNPTTTDAREIGASVDRAVRDRKSMVHDKVKQAYSEARLAGELEEPVAIDGLTETLQTLTNMEGVAPNIAAARKEALRLGILAEGDDGLVAVPQPIDTVEAFRQFINNATDMKDGRQKLARSRLLASIDAATEDKGGPLYRRARRLAASEFAEFSGHELAKQLLSTKGNVDARRISLADISDKIIVDAPVEEMNKMRGTLLKAGPDGKQAWQDLKAYGIHFLMQKAYGKQLNDRGQPVMTPATFIKSIEKFDKEGKLESLYGKKQAQIMRDMAELSRLLETAPPGAINHSNTSSALLTAIVEGGMTGLLTGLPLPTVTAIREGTKLVKNQALKHRINQALAGK